MDRLANRILSTKSDKYISQKQHSFAQQHKLKAKLALGIK
jgi:hypothetical protein